MKKVRRVQKSAAVFLCFLTALFLIPTTASFADVAAQPPASALVSEVGDAAGDVVQPGGADADGTATVDEAVAVEQTSMDMVSEEANSDAAIDPEAVIDEEEAVADEAIVEEEEDIQFPGFDFSQGFGDVTVYVNAPEGALREGAEVSIVPVTLLDKNERELEATYGAEYMIRKYVAFDIKFFYKGEEIQPAKEIEVRFEFAQSNKLSESDNLQVFHMDNVVAKVINPEAGADATVATGDPGAATVVEQIDNAVIENGAVTFEAEHFSIYGTSDIQVKNWGLTTYFGEERDIFNDDDWDAAYPEIDVKDEAYPKAWIEMTSEEQVAWVSSHPNDIHAADGNTQIQLTKAIKPTGGNENEFVIDLTVRTKQEAMQTYFKPDVAVTLVLDLSGSMDWAVSADKAPSGNEESRLNCMKEAVRSFLNQYADAVANRWISIVIFDQYASSVSLNSGTGASQYWVRVTDGNLTAVKDTVTNLKLRNTSGGTNTQAGLLLANNLISNANVPKLNNNAVGAAPIPADKRFVILFTDGAPCYIVTSGDTTTTDFDRVPSLRGTVALRGNANGNDRTTNYYDGTSFRGNGVAENAAQNAATKLKGTIPADNFFAIGFGAGVVNQYTGDFLSALAGKNYVETASVAELINAFHEIYGTIAGATSWNVTDPMGPYIDYEGPVTPLESAKQIDANGNGFVWNLLETKPEIEWTDDHPAQKIFVYSFSYKVKLTDRNKADFHYTGEDVSQLTNGTTTLNYTITRYYDNPTKQNESSVGHEANFNVPSVNPMSATPSSGIKINADTKEPIEGVEFLLEKYVGSGNYATDSTHWDTFYYDKSKADYTRDYSVIDPDGTDGPYVYTTNSDGKVDFGPLSFGYYRLVEAPHPGYFEVAAPLYFQVSFGHLIDLNEDDELIFPEKGDGEGYEEFAGSIVIMNSESVDVSVSKTWDDDEDWAGMRPDSVTVHLYANDEPVEDCEPEVLSEDNNWSYTWEKLPKYADGEVIAYSVVEDSVDGYVASYSDPELCEHMDEEGNATGTYYYDITVTNKHVSEISVSVDKDTIKRTAVAYVSDEEGVDNVADQEQYVYEINFKNESDVALEDFVIEDHLAEVAQGIHIDEVWAPMVEGSSNVNDDGDAFMTVSYKTLMGGDRWFDLGDVLLNGQKIDGLSGFGDDNYLTALRFDFGKVDAGFTSGNGVDIQGNGASEASVMTVQTQSQSPIAAFLGIFMPIRAFAAEEDGHLPITYVVHAAHALSGDTNIASAVSVIGTLGAMTATASDTVNTVAIAPTEVAPVAPEFGWPQGNIERPVRRVTTTTTFLPKTGDGMILGIPVAAMVISAAALVLLVVFTRRRKALQNAESAGTGAATETKKHMKNSTLVALFIGIGFAAIAFSQPAPVSAATDQQLSRVETVAGFTQDQLDSWLADQVAAGRISAADARLVAADQISLGTPGKNAMIERTGSVSMTVKTNDIDAIDFDAFNALSTQITIKPSADPAGELDANGEVPLYGAYRDTADATKGGVEFESLATGRPSLEDQYLATVHYRGYEAIKGYSAIYAPRNVVEVIYDGGTTFIGGGVAAGGGAAVAGGGAAVAAGGDEAVIPGADVPAAGVDGDTIINANDTPLAAAANAIADAMTTEAGGLPLWIWVVIVAAIGAIIVVAFARRNHDRRALEMAE